MKRQTPKLPGRGRRGSAKNGHTVSAASGQPKERAVGQSALARKRQRLHADARSPKAEDGGHVSSATASGQIRRSTSSAPSGKVRGHPPFADNGHKIAAAAPSLPIPKAEDVGQLSIVAPSGHTKGAISSVPKRKARGHSVTADNGHQTGAAAPSVPIAIICENIQELRARHKMWLRQRIRTTNTACSLLARVMGDRGGKTEDAERKRLWSRAIKLFSEFIAQKEMSETDAAIINPCLMDLVRFARSLDPIKEALRDIERGLEQGGIDLRARLNLSKPKGFGDLAFAVLVGEAGDFSGYARDRLLFKRLGLIPFDGKAGKTWKMQPANAKRHLTAEEWTKFGYDGRRLAAVYGYLLDALFKHQWQSGKAEGTAGQPKGPYGKIYADRIAYATLTHPEWTPAHRRQDALRVMAQAVLRDTWKEWRLATKAMPEMARKDSPAATPPSRLKRHAATSPLLETADTVVPRVVSPKHVEAIPI